MLERWAQHLARSVRGERSTDELGKKWTEAGLCTTPHPWVLGVLPTGFLFYFYLLIGRWEGGEWREAQLSIKVVPLTTKTCSFKHTCLYFKSSADITHFFWNQDSHLRECASHESKQLEVCAPHLAASALFHSFLLSQKGHFMSVSACSLFSLDQTQLALKMEFHIF